MGETRVEHIGYIGMMNVNMFNTAINEVNYDVASVDGKVLISGKAKGNSFSFLTGNLAKGTYILVMKGTGGETAISKFEIAEYK